MPAFLGGKVSTLLNASDFSFGRDAPTKSSPSRATVPLGISREGTGFSSLRIAGCFARKIAARLARIFPRLRNARRAR